MLNKREGQKFIISEKSKKWIKENKCPNCGLHKDKWKRRKDWRCCSKKCSDEFYINYGYISWQQFREKALKRDNYTCVKCGDNRKEVSVMVKKKRITNFKAAAFRKDMKFTYEYYTIKEMRNNLIGDHILPIALGGEEFDLDNVQTLCSACDKIKTAKDQGDIAKQRRREKELIKYIK